MTEEQQKRLVEFVKEVACLRISQDQLEVMAEWDSERSPDYPSECFDDGQTSMKALIALDARKCLKECGL